MSNQLSDSELKDTKFEAEVISKDSNSQVKVTNRESTVTVTFAPDCNKRFENLAKVGANLKFYNLEKKSAQELIFTNGSYLLAIPPMSAFPPKKTITSKEVMKRGESPPRDSCHSDEIDKLYDEWATEKTMQLLSGELGGPNLLQNLFGRTRDGALIEEKKSGKVTIHGLRLRDSRTPGLQDSGTPRLWDSKTPGLWDSRTPGLPNSKTPELQDSRIPTLNPNVKGCVFGELLIFFR